MKLTSDTTSVLKNFATINPNLVVNEGGVLKTITEAKNILAIANVTESFPVPFGIYDLTEFLAVVNLIDDAELKFGEDSVNIKAGSTRVNYRYADRSVLTFPEKDLKMPATDLSITLTEETINQIRKAASVLGNATLSIKSENGKATLNVVDPADSSVTTFSIDTDIATDSEFDYHLGIGNLKILAGSYDVQISNAKISHWKNTSFPIEYFIALEKSSVTS